MPKVSEAPHENSMTEKFMFYFLERIVTNYSITYRKLISRRGCTQGSNGQKSSMITVKSLGKIFINVMNPAI